MKVLTFGRAVRLAMLGGAIYYVRKHGGLRSTWDQLSEKLKPTIDQAKAKMQQVSQTVGEKAEKVSEKVGEEIEEKRKTAGEEPQEAQIESVEGVPSPQPGYGTGIGTEVGSTVTEVGERGNKTNY